MRAQFSLLKLKTVNGQTYFKARFFDSEGKQYRAIALRDCQTRQQATIKANDLLSSLAPDDPPAMKYLLDFWTDDSDYARGRKLRGGTLSMRYLEDNRRVLRLHFAPYAGKKKLSGITPAFLEEVILSLSEKGVGPRTINVLRQAILVAFNYRSRLYRTPNPLMYVEKAKETPRERGILSVDEIKKIMDLPEINPRMKTAVALAAFCGMRAGEIRGLQYTDIDTTKGMISIQHNFVDNREGIKAPKWGSTRVVPAPKIVLELIESCRTSNPSAFFVLGLDKSPIEIRTLKRGYPRLLEQIGISDEERIRRNLCFHGLRHTYVSLMRASGIPDFIVMRLAGHKSPRMMENYSHAEVADFRTVRKVLESSLEGLPEHPEKEVEAVG